MNHHNDNEIIHIICLFLYWKINKLTYWNDPYRKSSDLKDMSIESLQMSTLFLVRFTLSLVHLRDISQYRWKDRHRRKSLKDDRKFRPRDETSSVSYHSRSEKMMNKSLFIIFWLLVNHSENDSVKKKLTWWVFVIIFPLRFLGETFFFHDIRCHTGRRSFKFDKIVSWLSWIFLKWLKIRILRILVLDSKLLTLAIP